MTTHFTRIFGYKRDGSACLFELAPGDTLPGDWSHDISIIENPEHRTGEAISERAKVSVKFPVRVSKPDDDEDVIEDEDNGDPMPLRYDENNVQIEEPIMKRRGRPPGSRNAERQ